MTKCYGSWCAFGGSNSRQPQIRKDRNTSRIKARKTRFLHRDRTKCLKRHLLMAERKMKLDHANSETPLRHEPKPAKTARKRGLLTKAAQILVRLRSENIETPAGARPEGRDLLHQTGCRTSTFKTHNTTSRSVECWRWLRKDPSAWDPKRPKHQQDQGPKNAIFRHQTGCRTSTFKTHLNTSRGVDSWRWLLKISSASQIRKDRNTSRIKARRTRVFTPEGLPPSKRI